MTTRTPAPRSMVLRGRPGDGRPVVRGRPRRSPRRAGPGSAVFVPALALVLALDLALAPATAADAPDLDRLLEMPFEELLQVQIRSAGKRAEEVRDIPASVTIVTREEIERYGWQTLQGLLASVPGFFILSNTEDRFIGARGAVGGGVQFLVNGIAQHPSRQKVLTVPEIARLDIPVESIDRVEVIRGPMSVIYGNNAFLGVVNVVTNDPAASGSRLSATLGNRGTGGVFGRLTGSARDGYFVLNAGARQDDGLGGAYADMLGPARLAALDPAMHRDMDGDVGEQTASLDAFGRWRGLTAQLRLNRRDYGIYAFTPAFRDGTAIRLNTLHLALGWEHRFSDALGLRITATQSEEDYDVYRADFLLADLDADQDQFSRRRELELDLHWRPRPGLDALAGYRLLAIDGVRNRAHFPPLLDRTNRLDGYASHDLFAEVGWQLARPLRLVAGGRLSLLPAAYRIEETNWLTGTTTAYTRRMPDARQPDGRLALLWSPRADRVLKLIWGTASQDSGDSSFAAPERIETLELTGTLTGARFLVTGSLFQNRIDHIARTIQVWDPVTGDYAAIDDNSGRWRTRGAELIAEARPLAALGLSASLTWQQTDDLAAGIDPGYAPALLAKLKADWQRGPWTLAAWGNYIASMQPDWDFVAGPVQGVVARIGEPVPGYWDIGLNLRWQPGARVGDGAGPGPYAALHVANLLDGDHRDPANELTALERGLIGPGRTLTLTFGYAF